MKILAIERDVPGAPAEAFGPILREEAAHLWKLVQAGVVRETYFRADRTDAVLMLECTNVDEAIRVLGEFPLVQAGLIVFEVIPLRAYPGFERLFGT